MLKDIVDIKKLPDLHSDLHPDDSANIINLCSENNLLESHSYSYTRNGLLVFKRIKASYCEFCERVHDSDNTLIVNAVREDAIVKVFKSCRKHKAEKNGSSILIGEFISSKAPVDVNSEAEQNKNFKVLEPWSEKLIEKFINEINEGKSLIPHGNLFSKLAAEHKTIYSENSMREFELSPTLCVKAKMKMGKTKALKKYIEKHFDNKLSPSKIVFVSFRQTFSGNIKEIFDDFILYSDVKGLLYQNKIIVQVESLHRVAVECEPPDLLVLDECESIFEQFDSGLLRNFTDSFAKFKWLIKYSKHVIAMDANLQNRTYNTLNMLRPGFDKRGIVYHCNEYKNGLDDNYFVTSDKLKWLGALYSTIESDQKVALPISSLTEAKVIMENIKRKFPDKLVNLYSSETTISEKKEHFSNVHEFWSKYDVLIYTPTVSAGVSFELAHFDKMFGYFTDQSCPAETCLQMMGRIRNLKDKSYYVYLSASGNTLPVTKDSIIEHLYEKRENLYRQFDEIGLTIEYKPNGEVKHHYSDYFHLWVENSIVKNMSRNSFIKVFLHLISTTGAKIHKLSEQVFSEMTGINYIVDGCINGELSEINEMHSAIRSEIRKIFCDNVSNSKELTTDEVQEIKDCILCQKDITKEQKYAYEKYKLRTEYKYYGNIDSVFVDVYHNNRHRRIFKNINRILRYENPIESLQKIKEEEVANYDFSIRLNDKYHHLDINRKYVYDQHRYAIGFIQLCGWSNIHDKKYVHKNNIIQNFKNNEKTLFESLKSACTEFEIKNINVSKVRLMAGDSYLKPIIKTINKILNLMYGIEMIGRKDGMYRLSQCTLFAMGNSDTMPSITINY